MSVKWKCCGKDYNNIDDRKMKTNIMDEKLNERNRRDAIDALHKEIVEGVDAEDSLWQAIIAYEGHSFHTSSGLPFQYTVKRKRDGSYSGELAINRKEGSKTLTRSSVMYRSEEHTSELQSR